MAVKVAEAGLDISKSHTQCTEQLAGLYEDIQSPENEIPIATSGIMRDHFPVIDQITKR